MPSFSQLSFGDPLLPATRPYDSCDDGELRVGTGPWPIRAFHSLTTPVIYQRYTCDLNLANEIQCWNFCGDKWEKTILFLLGVSRLEDQKFGFFMSTQGENLPKSGIL